MPPTPELRSSDKGKDLNNAGEQLGCKCRCAHLVALRLTMLPLSVCSCRVRPLPVVERDTSGRLYLRRLRSLLCKRAEAEGAAAVMRTRFRIHDRGTRLRNRLSEWRYRRRGCRTCTCETAVTCDPMANGRCMMDWRGRGAACDAATG